MGFHNYYYYYYKCNMGLVPFGLPCFSLGFWFSEDRWTVFLAEFLDDVI